VALLYGLGDAAGKVDDLILLGGVCLDGLVPEHVHGGAPRLKGAWVAEASVAVCGGLGRVL